MSVEAFVRCAKAQVGKKYVWATAGPDTYDCSGLVAYCAAQAGMPGLSRSSHTQYTLGKAVNTGKGIKPGDLLFYDTMGDGAGHVGIAIGNGRSVHALNEQRGVIESAVDANYGGPFIGARRLDFGDAEKPTPDKTAANITENITRAAASPVTLATAFRSIPALPLATWEAEFAARQSPLTKPEIHDCFAACGGLAIALDQAIGETSLKDADAVRDKNLLRLTELDGSTFKKYSAYWKSFAEYVRRVFDPAYKATGGAPGPYYPSAAGGVVPGYDLSIAGYKVIYQGGPGCLSSRGVNCANGERYDPNRPMTGASVVSDASAPSINRSIAASMIRFDRWFGGPVGPTGPTGGTAPTGPMPGRALVFGRVPKPAWQDRQIPDRNNRAWDNLGQRHLRGVVYHRMVGTLWGTDGWFRGGGGGAGLTDFGIDNTSGETLEWNSYLGRGRAGISPNRAGHASGSWQNPPGDGRAFVAKYGVSAINRDLVSLELAGNYDSPLSESAIAQIVALSAYLADQAHVPWDRYPLNPHTGLIFTYWHSEFQNHKPCPGDVVKRATTAIIEQTKARLREYQT